MSNEALIYLIRTYKYDEAINLLKILNDDDIINSYNKLYDNPLYVLCDLFDGIVYDKYYVNNYFIIKNEKNDKTIKQIIKNILDDTKLFYNLFNELIKRNSNIQFNSNIQIKNNCIGFLVNFGLLLDKIKFFHQDENNKIDYNNFVNIPLFIDYLIKNDTQNSTDKFSFEAPTR